MAGLDLLKTVKLAETDYAKQLLKNKKVKQAENLPVYDRVISVTPLAAAQNGQAVKNMAYTSKLYGGITERNIDQARIQNQAIGMHNLDVDRKKQFEEQERLAAEAAKGLKDAQAGWGFSGGKDGAKFNTDGISRPDLMIGGEGNYNATGIGYQDLKGNKGSISSSQNNVLNSALDAADKRGASAYEKQILVATIMAETGARNLSGGDRDSAGILQQRPSQGWGTHAQVTNIDYATNKFLGALKPNLGKGGSGWMDAQKTQRSAYSNGANYKNYWGMAGKVISSFQANPVGASVKANTKTTQWISNQLGKYHDYDKAYGTQCVDLFRYYLQYQGVTQVPSMGRSGGAKELWLNPVQTQAMTKRGFKQVPKTSRAATGDVVVFSGAYGKGFGHVGVVTKDDGKHIWVLNSNSSTVGNGKATNIVKYNKNAVLGYYRK